MVLLRVSKDLRQIEGIYPSEPILAAASSAIAAHYGWLNPLKTFVTSLRHGVVDKGFRGEFVTKVLLCMAMEDALKANPLPSNNECFEYMRPVTVSQFLSALLQLNFSNIQGERRPSRVLMKI